MFGPPLGHIQHVSVCHTPYMSSGLHYIWAQLLAAAAIPSVAFFAGGTVLHSLSVALLVLHPVLLV